MAEGKTKEIIVEMAENGDMRADALKEGKYAAENIKNESAIAAHLKKFFDNKYGPNWHCVVGKSFHAYTSYESKHYIFFYEGPLAVLLYKMG